MAASGADFTDGLVYAIVALPLLPGAHIASEQIKQGCYAEAVRTVVTTVIVVLVLAVGVSVTGWILRQAA